MSTISDVLQELEAIGATIEPAGDGLLLRAGPKPVPVRLIRRVRDAKSEILAFFHQEGWALPLTPGFARVVEQADGEAGLEQPCAARRGRVQALDSGFLHFCAECGRFAAFGYEVHLRAERLGRWYCGEHRPVARY
jgi:hypothetical protein